MTLLCKICWHRREMGDTTEAPSIAVATCTELNAPVCQKHANYCIEEGHGAIPFDEDGDMYAAADDALTNEIKERP